jgi:hypothetical protein
MAPSRSELREIMQTTIQHICKLWSLADLVSSGKSVAMDYIAQPGRGENFGPTQEGFGGG